MTDALDEDLTAAAPRVRERTPELHAALHELIAETDQLTRHAADETIRRKRRIAAVAFTATALLGTGATAAAAGWLPAPWWENQEAVTQSVTSASGAECTVTYAARAFSDLAHPVSDAERAAAMSAATEFLRDFNYAGIAHMDNDSVFQTLNRRLNRALRQQGLSTHAVGVALASDCPNEADR